MAGALSNKVVLLTVVVTVLLLNHSEATIEKTRESRATIRRSKRQMASFLQQPMAVFTDMTKSKESPLLSAELSAQIESIIQSFLEEADVQYYAISVVRDGQTAFTSGQVTSPFFIDNSISMIFKSSAILTRVGVRASEFSLDDPVEKFLPNFRKLAPHISPGITLRQLMENASGASQEISQENVQAGYEDDRTFLVDRAIKEWRSKVLEQRAEMLELGQTTGTEIHLERTPFPAMEFAILSQALAKVSSEASFSPKIWQNFVEEFLNGVEMSNTGTDLGGRDFSEAGTVFDIKSIESAGQWYSTATDLAKCLVNLLRFDRSVQWDPSVREWTISWAIQEAKGSGIGLTWEQEEINFRGKSEFVVTNGGAVADFGSFIGLHPRTKLGVSVLLVAGKSTEPGAIANAVGSQILRSLIPPLSKSVDSYYSGSYVCQPAPPLVRDFNDRSNTRYSDTVEVLGGEVNVTSSPSFGLQASLSISVMVSGKPQHRRGQFLMSSRPSAEASNSIWTLFDLSNPPDSKRSIAASRDILRGITFKFEQWGEAVIEKVHEPTPGVVYCRRQVEQIQETHNTM